MIIEKPKGMKYITRCDYPRTHGWWVRILDCRDGNGKTSKFFRDTKYMYDGWSSEEAKEEGLKEAKKFRDRHFNHLTKSQKTVKHDHKKGKIYGEGVFVEWLERGSHLWPYVTASWWEDGKQRRRTFSATKWGWDEAWRLAREVRKEMTKHKIDCRKNGGVKC